MTWVQGGAPAQWVDPLLYFFSAQNDRTLRDLVTEVLYPRSSGGYTDVPVEVIQRALGTWAAEGKMTTAWGESVTRVGAMLWPPSAITAYWKGAHKQLPRSTWRRRLLR